MQGKQWIVLVIVLGLVALGNCQVRGPGGSRGKKSTNKDEDNYTCSALCRCARRKRSKVSHMILHHLFVHRPMGMNTIHYRSWDKHKSKLIHRQQT